MPQGGALGQLAAHRMTEQVRRVPAEGIQDRDRVIGHVLGGVSGGAPAQYRGDRAGGPGIRETGIREMGGLASIALVIGGDMETTAHQLIDQPRWPPESRHRQAHDQQERLAPAPHTARLAAKLEAFAILNTTVALFVQNEFSGGSARQQRNAAYLNHALATGRYPQLAELLAPASPAQMSPAEATAEPADHYRDILARILSGLLNS